VASRLGDDLLDCVNMILLMLPGTAVTYSGEELGVENMLVPWDPTEPEDSGESEEGESWFYETVGHATRSNKKSRNTKVKVVHVLN
jgi:hypothetical protein